MKTEPGAVRSMQTSGFGISGSILKWMAVLIMAIDHAGAGLLEAYVQGFVHTRNVKKYAVRLGIFALASEIPFDLALRVTPFYWKHQNVFFTLLIGLLAVWFMKSFNNRLWARVSGLLAGAALAELLGTDYGAFGIALIVLLYLLQDKKAWQCILGAICCAWETTAPLAFILIWFYNGKRGRQPRWFFYWFYPVHLLLYALVGMYVLPAVLL